jgi:hypothetical protein
VNPRFLPFKRRLRPPPFGCAAMPGDARRVRTRRTRPHTTAPGPTRPPRFTRRKCDCGLRRQHFLHAKRQSARMRMPRDTGGTRTHGGTGCERRQMRAAPGASGTGSPAAPRQLRRRSNPALRAVAGCRKCEPEVIGFASSAGDHPMTAAIQGSTKARSPPGSASRPHTR